MNIFLIVYISVHEWLMNIQSKLCARKGNTDDVPWKLHTERELIKRVNQDIRKQTNNRVNCNWNSVNHKGICELYENAEICRAFYGNDSLIHSF